MHRSDAGDAGAHNAGAAASDIQCIGPLCAAVDGHVAKRRRSDFEGVVAAAAVRGLAGAKRNRVIARAEVDDVAIGGTDDCDAGEAPAVSSNVQVAFSPARSVTSVRSRPCLPAR